MEFRRKNGDFKAREDLKLVKGIGGKVFEQCSGFLRISKSTKENGDGSEKPAKPAKSVKKSGKSSVQAGAADWNPLDATNIHPESYLAATELVKLAGAVLEEIGSNQFVNTITSFVCKQNPEELATRYVVKYKKVKTGFRKFLKCDLLLQAEDRSTYSGSNHRNAFHNSI